MNQPIDAPRGFLPTDGSFTADELVAYVNTMSPAQLWFAAVGTRDPQELQKHLFGLVNAIGANVAYDAVEGTPAQARADLIRQYTSSAIAETGDLPDAVNWMLSRCFSDVVRCFNTTVSAHLDEYTHPSDSLSD